VIPLRLPFEDWRFFGSSSGSPVHPTARVESLHSEVTLGQRNIFLQPAFV